MILADTSIWVDHLRAGDDQLGELLDSGRVLGHPFVTGELALGHLRQRDLILRSLMELPQAVVASDHEVLQLINQEQMFARGIGYVDAHLIAAVRLTPEAWLWTRDTRLHAFAVGAGLALARTGC